MKKFLLWSLAVIAVLAALLGILKIKHAMNKPQPNYIMLGLEACYQGNLDLATKYFEKEIEESPDHSYARQQARFALVQTRYRMGDYAKALDAADEALEEFSDVDSIAISFLTTKGDVLHAMGKTDEAIENYGKSLALVPGSAYTHAQRALVYLETGDTLKAEADYRAAIAIDSTYSTPYIGLATIDMVRLNFEAAARTLSRAVELDTYDGDVYAFRGKAYLALGKLDQAADDYIKAVEMENSDSAFDNIYELAGQARKVMKRHLLTKAKSDTENEIWYFLLGRMSHTDGEYKKTVEYYTKSNDIKPNAGCWGFIATCHYEHGNYTQALDAVEKGLEISPNNGRLLDLKADIITAMER